MFYLILEEINVIALSFNVCLRFMSLILKFLSRKITEFNAGSPSLVRAADITNWFSRRPFPIL